MASHRPLACLPLLGACGLFASEPGPAMAPGWWQTRSLAQVPVAELAAVDLGDGSWREAAVQLGLEPEALEPRRFGSLELMTLTEGEDVRVGIYVEGEAHHGFVLRRLAREPGGAAQALQAVSRASGLDTTWTAWTDDLYVYAVADTKPVIILGCRRTDAEECHLRRLPEGQGAEDWVASGTEGTAVRGETWGR